MLFFIPYKHMAINVALTPDEIKSVITRAVWPKRKWFQGFSNKTGYEGSVSSKGFKINRIISYQNVCLPSLYGAFCPHNDGVRIEIDVRMDAAGIGFSLGWGIGLSLVLLLFIADSVMSSRLHSGIPVFSALLVSLYFVTILLFNYEANKAIGFMKELFEEHVIAT